MDSSYGYSLRPVDKEVRELAYENLKRKTAMRHYAPKSYAPSSRPITKDLVTAPVFHPRRMQHQADTVPAPPKFVKRESDLPEHVIELAHDYNIPLNSIRMDPVIRTTEGVMIFEEYIARLHRALEEDARTPSDVSRPDSKAASPEDRYLAPRMPVNGGRVAEHFRNNETTVPVEQVNSSTIVANMPIPSAPMPSDTRRVVMIHNLNPTKLSVDALFTLCSAFGDVDRVKIMYNKRDTAFVQMASISDANSLMRHLQGLEVWGKCLVLVKSKMEEIRLPYSLDDRATVNLTKDFSDSVDRRFGKKFAQHRAYICSPTKNLHCCNLPEEFDVEELKACFDPENVHIEAIVPVQDRPFMYNVLCHNVSSSVEILMFKHASEFKGKKVRLSFTSLPAQTQN